MLDLGRQNLYLGNVLLLNQVLELVVFPLSDRNFVRKESFEFLLRPSLGLANAKPHIGQCDDCCSGVDEAKHGPQVGRVVELGRGERDDPDGEEEGHNRA